MKYVVALAVIFLSLNTAHAQENRFNAELDKFCNGVIKEFGSIPAERKIILDELAKQLSGKKYVVFTCNTNSRRTLMLQVWAQTSFYYYSLFGKYAFSLGNTVTDVYPGVAGILSEAGFSVNYLKSAEPNGYVISINKDYPLNILSSKNEVGTIDTAKGIVVNICFEDEEQGASTAFSHIDLPYQSPTHFEQTPQERQKYRELNRQIAVEMLYMSEKIKSILVERDKGIHNH
ncbi:MAG: hypothetical protein KIS94_07055 [Chitinophagales bacterium]|nr:hypothetical protein [Chitinophagales bacterium]